MKIVLRTVAVVFVAAALFLLAAVLNALGSDGGARPGVAVAYVLGSIALTALAVALWRRTVRSHSPAGPAS
jgi:hypothetical protein